ncbi:MAG: NUDIX hydrolase [Patescibacteria group bacterium]
MAIIVPAALRRWRPVGRAHVLREKGGLALVEQRFRHPGTGKAVPFISFTRQDGVTVVPLTTDGEIVLVRQFKQAVRDLILEAPGGALKPGEDPVEAARRELRQETGFEAATVVRTSPRVGFLISPRRSPSIFHTCIATGCRFHGKQRLDRREDAIEVRTYTMSEIWQLIKNGEIHSEETVFAILYAERLGLLPL